MYYAHTIAEVRKALKPSDAVFSSHLRWMCDQIEKMDQDSVSEAVKAGRWIGWVLAHVEMMQLWHNNQSRNLIRIDRQAGRDVPVLFETVT